MTTGRNTLGTFLRSNTFLKSGIYGAATALSFAPFNIFPIFIATFGWIFARIGKGDRNRSFLVELFCFFFGLHLACLYCVVYPLMMDFKKYGILIPFAVALIPTYISMFLLLPSWIISRRFHTFTTISRGPVAFALLLP